MRTINMRRLERPCARVYAPSASPRTRFSTATSDPSPSTRARAFESARVDGAHPRVPPTAQTCARSLRRGFVETPARRASATTTPSAASRPIPRDRKTFHSRVRSSTPLPCARSSSIHLSETTARDTVAPFFPERFDKSTTTSVRADCTNRATRRPPPCSTRLASRSDPSVASTVPCTADRFVHPSHAR